MTPIIDTDPAPGIGARAGAATEVPGRPRKTLLLVDDNRSFLLALKNIIDGWQGVRVIGCAHDGPSALASARAQQPDLVLMDIAMPGQCGPDVARHMLDWPLPPRVVMMSLNDGPVYRAAARRMGAAGFVGKADILVELAPLIEHLIADDPGDPQPSAPSA